jgi:hypothetical protein
LIQNIQSHGTRWVWFASTADTNKKAWPRVSLKFFSVKIETGRLFFDSVGEYCPCSGASLYRMCLRGLQVRRISGDGVWGSSAQFIKIPYRTPTVNRAVLPLMSLKIPEEE